MRAQMDQGRADWDDNTAKMFLDLCIAEKEKLNFNNKGLTKTGWQNLYRGFKDQTRRAYSTKQLQNKFSSLKRTYNLWRKLKNKSGPACHKTTGTFIGDDDRWDNQIAENSEAERFRGKALPFEDELTILFGSNGDEDGTVLCAGGVGDRTPSAGSDDNRARMTEDNRGRSEDNAARSSVGRASQRSCKEHVVDGPPNKKTKSMEYYLECIFETMLERSRNERSAMRREQEEVTELLRLVEEDGVSQGSELFFIAAELFMSPARRAAFRCIAAPENRVAWLRWTWDNVEKN